MDLTPPTAAQFKARFGIFEDLAAERIAAVIDEAMTYVDDSWITADQQPAILYMTAHLLIREGALTASAAAGAAVVTRGAVLKVRVGDVETNYADAGEAGGSTGGGTTDPLLTTEYGRRFSELRLRSFPPIYVV